MSESNGNGTAPRSSLHQWMSAVTNSESSLLDRFENALHNNELVTNAFINRIEWWNRILDPQRNINKECGYAAEIAPLEYRMMYNRDAISARVVEVLPMESWQVQPSVYEDEDSETETEFERAWKEIHKNLHGSMYSSGEVAKNGSYYQDDEGSLIWSYLLRLDIMSGIGHYGVMLLGIDDGRPLMMPAEGFEDHDSEAYLGTDAQYANDPLRPSTVGYDDYTQKQIAGEQPARMDQIAQIPPMVPGSEGYGDVTKKGRHRLLYLRIFDEQSAQITRWERDPHNPRFGLPTMYLITFNDQFGANTSGAGIPIASTNVHWSRVLHFCDKVGINESLAYPRMQQVWNRLIDLTKVYGASGEGFWQMAFTILSGETHPQLGGDVKIDMNSIAAQVAKVRTGLKRDLISAGMAWKSIAPTVSDPTPFKDAFIEAICIELGCPKRVFMGSERGELASSQDDSAWNDRLRHRQSFVLTPRLIVPFVDRLIQMKVLPEPKGFSVVWPDLESLSDKDKAAIALTKTQAIAAFFGGQPEAGMTAADFWTRVMGEDHESAEEIVEGAQQALEEESHLSPSMQPQEETPPEGAILKEGETMVHPQTGEPLGPSDENSDMLDGE